MLVHSHSYLNRHGLFSFCVIAPCVCVCVRGLVGDKFQS